MRLRYALKNLTMARTRFLIAVVGIAFASFLMALQGSLLYGFTFAASRIVDAVGGDIWMVAPGIPAFDFVSPIEERAAWLAKGVPGVAATGRGIAGWAPFETPAGDRTYVFVVGVDRAIAGAIPLEAIHAAMFDGQDAPVASDATDRPRLSPGLPARVAIGGRRADLVMQTEGFASFLGTPFVLADIKDARRFLPLREGFVSFVTAVAEPSTNLAALRQRLQERFPSLAVRTADEFSIRSRIFWLIKTGAGGALTLAAVLGFLLGLSVVAQTIYSVTAENVEEYATLKAMGATNGYLRSVVVLQSLACGVVGGAIGLAGLAPFAKMATAIVTWIEVPYWIYAVVAFFIAVLCVLAALVAANPATHAEPAKVFRA